MRDGLATQQDVLRYSVKAAVISYLSTRMDMPDARTYGSVRAGESYMPLTVCTRDGSKKIVTDVRWMQSRLRIWTIPERQNSKKREKAPYMPLTFASKSATLSGPDLGLPFSFRPERSTSSCVSDRLGRKGIGVLGRLEMN